MAELEQAQLTRLMLDDLDRSGINKRHVETLGLKVLSRQETSEWMKNPEIAIPTYEIPYFNSAGIRTGYSRLKNLDPGKKFGKKTSHKKKQSIKYLQKPNTAPHLYIPTTYAWPRGENGKIAVERLVITEGEKKAAKACLCGIPTVALGGVDSFKSSKRGIFLLEEFEDFDLTITDVEVCYDSDLNTNENVRKALHQLAAELLTRNPQSIGYVMLDGEADDSSGKMGLDDFLAQYAKSKDALKAFNSLKRNIDKRQSIMSILDSELCYLRSVGRVYNIPDDRYYDGTASVIVDYGPRYRIPDPEDPRKQIPAVKVWLDTRGEDTWCEELVYEPGMPKRYRPPKAKADNINLWTPSKTKPIAGDVTLWLQLVRYVMGSEATTQWFLQWLAYPLQHPGTKVLQAVFVYSTMQGVGKNFIIEPLLREIYEDAYEAIQADALDDKYNAWAKCKQFIFGEEIYMSDKRDREATMGRLNALITGEYVTVNEKYRPHERFKNYAQLYLTSNHSNALALSFTDRRMLVVHAPEKPLAEDFYTELDAWCKEKDSAGKVLSYLLNEVDVSMFNPRANAPYTDDKEEIVEHGQDLVQNYLAILMNTPKVIYENNGVLPDQKLYSTAELFAAINTYARNHEMPELRISPTSLGRYLSGNKLPCRRVSISNYHRITLYAAFDKKRWRTAKDKEWARHYRLLCPIYKERKKTKIEGQPREKADVIDIRTKEKMQ